MARFDLYRNEGRSKAGTPYLVDVQNTVISGLATRVVIPLRTLDAFGTLAIPPDLCPLVTIADIQYFLDTPQMAAIPLSELTIQVGTLQPYQPQIMAALDRVLGAY